MMAWTEREAALMRTHQMSGAVSEVEACLCYPILGGGKTSSMPVSLCVGPMGIATMTLCSLQRERC